MSWTKKITHPSAMLKKGDDVHAVVLNVDKERKRVALGQFLKLLEVSSGRTNVLEQDRSQGRAEAVSKSTDVGERIVDVDRRYLGCAKPYSPALLVLGTEDVIFALTQPIAQSLKRDRQPRETFSDVGGLR